MRLFDTVLITASSERQAGAFRALLERWPSIEAAGDVEIGGTFLIRGPVHLPLAVAR